MRTIPAAEQFRGCLLGLALGDALGAAVETFPPSVADEYAAALSRETVPGPGPNGWVFGQVTDDTQLSRVLLQSIADAGEFDPADFAQRLRAFVESGRLVGGGPATLRTAKQLALGLSWEVCGMPSPYAGNGAAMRAGPLGIIYRPDPVRLTRVAVEQARVTHHDSRAIAGAVVMAWAVALASRGDAIVVEDFLDELAGVAKSIDGGFAAALSSLGKWIHLSPATVAGKLAGEGLEPEAASGWQGISSFVVSSVCWSLYAFLRNPDDWWAAMQVAIAVGGDTDTIASMTGAISGARLGDGVLPETLLSQVADGGQAVADELRVLAGRLENLAAVIPSEAREP